MSLSDLASLGSFVSGLAVLGSLVYLTLQVRQAERYQNSIAQQERAARLSDLQLRLATMADVFAKGNSGDDDLSLTQLRQFRHLTLAALFSGEDTFRQHKVGLISNDVFDAYCSQMKNLARQRGWRVMWKQLRLTKAEDFREFMDQIVAETTVVSPTDELANWKATVAAERISVATT